MRVVAGQWRGRSLLAPPGTTTRPTADRARQALFDMLVHAPWADGLADVPVLDAFAGTGALGLEALSRGAAAAEFFEQDRAALTALRSNIAACGAAARVHPGDACRAIGGPPARLVFLDPPYGLNLVEAAIGGLTASGRIASDTLLVAELGHDEPRPCWREIVGERGHGAGRVVIGRF